MTSVAEPKGELYDGSEMGSFSLSSEWTRVVTTCLMMHKAYDGDAVLRHVKSLEGVWKRHRILISVAVKHYNKYMGGLDISCFKGNRSPDLKKFSCLL